MTFARRADTALPPAFSAVFYRERHQALGLASDEEAASHYLREGRANGMAASPLAERGALVDLAGRHGSVLEIGPFCRPLLRGDGIEYLDVLNAAELRERAVKLGMDPARCPATIHYVGSLEQVGRHFDAVISSHSVEHQPDLVRHLEQVARVLRDDGRYYLIIPDKRYCFDHYLPESTIADVLAAYREARRVHSLASVIEHRALVTHNDAARHWRGDHGTRRTDALADQVRSALRSYDMSDGSYIDVHAWQFTPDSFRALIETLGRLGLSPLDVEEVYDTPRDRQEFCAVLSKRRPARRSPSPHHDQNIVFLQTADAFRYAPMLAASSTTVVEYCRRFGFHYESFVGIKRGYWNWQATYNRIVQLKELLDGGFSGWAVYLDADAYINDLTFDLPAYLSDKQEFGAIFATSGVTGEHWDVNAGVAIINFGHGEGRRLVESWWSAFQLISDERLHAASTWLDSDNDQDLLHQILRQDEAIAKHVLVESMDFINSRTAHFIRQHLRAQTLDLDARIRTIIEEVRIILRRDGAPTAVAAADLLPVEDREQAQLLHPVGLEPRLVECPSPPIRADLARIAIDAWQAAPLRRDPPAYQAAFATAMDQGDVDAVGAELAQLGKAQIAQGFMGGARQHRRCATDPLFARQRALRTYDALVSLAEIVGALPMESPDVGAWGRSVQIAPNELFAMIERQVGAGLAPPRHVGGYLGIEAGKGIILHLRMIEGIYNAWQLRKWAQVLGLHRVLELGGGAGWTAFYAGRLGLTDFQILDLPSMNAVQAYVLGATATPRARSFDTICDLAPGSIDIVLNEDSLPDMSQQDSEHLLHEVTRIGVRAMLSLNREAAGEEGSSRRTAGDLICEAGYQSAYRQRHGLRPGFTEELFLPVRSACEER